MADFIDLLDDEEDWADEAPERTKTEKTTTERTTAINAPPLECCICLSELGKTNVTALPCIHCFHTDCIESALKLSSLCPLCKYDSRKHDGDSQLQAQTQAQSQPRIRQAILPPVLPPVLPPMGGVMFLFGAPVMAPVQHQQSHNAHHEEENGEAAEDDVNQDHSDHAPRHGAIRRDRHQVRRRLFPATCQATIAHGPNAGQTCGRKPRPHARFCGYHN